MLKERRETMSEFKKKEADDKRTKRDDPIFRQEELKKELAAKKRFRSVPDLT